MQIQIEGTVNDSNGGGDDDDDDDDRTRETIFQASTILPQCFLNMH
jgi:hypothetical protein